MVLRPLGNHNARFRDYEKAVQFLTQAKNICTQNNAWNKAAIAANGLGLMYLNKGDVELSIYWFQEGLAFPNLSVSSQVLLQLNLGLAYLKNNDPTVARKITDAAGRLLELYPKSFNEGQRLENLGDLHNNLGDICSYLGQYEEAIGHLKTCIAFRKEQFGTANHRSVVQGILKLCTLFTATHQPDSTLFYVRLALESLLPKTALKDVYVNPPKAQLYAEHTLCGSFQLKIVALQALITQNSTDTGLLDRLLETCDLLFITDEILRQEYPFEESRLIRQSDSRPYFEAAISAAYRLQALTKQPGLAERAWQYAELARERLLNEQMHDREAAAQAPEAQKRQLGNLRAQRTQLQTQIFEKMIRSEATDSLDLQLFGTHLAWKALLVSIEKPLENTTPPLPSTDLQALRRILPSDQAMIEYFIGDSTAYTFVLTNQTLHFLQCPRLPDLKDATTQLRASLTEEGLRGTDDDISLFNQSSALLYDALLAEPLALLLPQVKHLVVVQDGLLYEVPFELLGHAPGFANFKTFPYLLRRYAVSYASSGSLLLKQSEKVQRLEAGSQPSFAGFAPLYNDADTLSQIVSRTRNLQVRSGAYRDLPESRKEVREIAALLQGKAYLGAEASEKQFKQQAPQSRILHLAMHTCLETRNPMFSKLLFSSSPLEKGEDNDLYAVEIYDLGLNAELVVLSACETGLGQVRQGEGVMSLARAFAFGGVTATVMSLWQVEDGATRELMVDFYKQLKTGIRKDDALQQAKLTYLKNCDPLRSSPYFWAGFIASGNMVPLFGRQ